MSPQLSTAAAAPRVSNSSFADSPIHHDCSRRRKRGEEEGNTVLYQREGCGSSFREFLWTFRTRRSFPYIHVHITTTMQFSEQFRSQSSDNAGILGREQKKLKLTTLQRVRDQADTDSQRRMFPWEFCMENSKPESAPLHASPPAVEELVKKIHDMELSQASLKQVMSKLSSSSTAQILTPWWRAGVGDGPWKQGTAVRQSSPYQKDSCNEEWSGSGGRGPSFTDKQYLNILQSMGQCVIVTDVNNRVIYWNRMAENLYGYSTEEALGKHVLELVLDSQDYSAANEIFQHILNGEIWTGQFPVENKTGERFLSLSTNAPFYDDSGAVVGVISVGCDSRLMQEVKSVITGQRDIGNDP